MQVDDSAFAFGPYRLLPAGRLLLRDGTPVPLGTRAFDLLAALIDARGETIARDALLRRVWPEGGMHANNLGVQISALRRALGGGAEQTYIATIPGRGFRFVAPVKRDSSPIFSDEPRPEERRLAPGNLGRAGAWPIGRDREIEAVLDALRRWPLVSVVGPGGIGKTRIALAVAAKGEDRFRDGVWLIDLAALAEPSAIAAGIAAVMALPIGAGATAPGDIARQLRHRAALLVFDNCEHVRREAAETASILLATCPHLRILATSQARLELEQEHVERIEPLAVPPEGKGLSVRALFDFAACALFLERAKAADRRFAATDADAPIIAEICRRLDGLPLAIELAASRHYALGLDQIRQGLDDRFRLLTGGERFGVERHPSLGAALAWSYGLLAPSEQRIVRHLSVLVGPFDAEAGLAVAQARADEIASLVDRSLLSVELGRHYRMLESTRAFAAGRLAETGERRTAGRAHAAYVEALFETASARWEIEPTAAWQALLMPALGNLRVALAWSFGADGDAGGIGCRLCAASLRFWHGASLMTEYRRWLDRALELIPEQAPQDEWLAARLWLANARSVLSVAIREPAARRAEALARAAGDHETLGRALALIGDARRRAGDFAGADTALVEAADLLQSSGAAKSCAEAIQQLAIVRHHRGDVAGARALNADALVRFRATGHEVGIIACLVRQANDQMAEGTVDAAIAATGEALALSRALQNRYMMELTLGNLASYQARRADWPAAWQAAREALPIAIELDDRAGVAAIVETLAMIAAQHRQHEASACLLGYSEAFYAEEGETREPTDQGAYEQLTAMLSGALEAEALTQCRAIGAKWTESIVLAAIGQLRLFA